MACRVSAAGLAGVRLSDGLGFTPAYIYAANGAEPRTNIAMATKPGNLMARTARPLRQTLPNDG